MNKTLKIVLGFIVINLQFVGFVGALMFPKVILADIIDHASKSMRKIESNKIFR